MVDPIGKTESLESSGIVIVTVLAFVNSVILYISPDATVYVVPVIAVPYEIKLTKFFVAIIDVSTLNVFEGSSVNPVPAVTTCAALNCVYEMFVEPNVIVPVVLRIYPFPPKAPCSTKQKSPYATSPEGELSASVALVRTHGVDPSPTVVTTYIPFCFASV